MALVNAKDILTTSELKKSERMLPNIMEKNIAKTAMEIVVKKASSSTE